MIRLLFEKQSPGGILLKRCFQKFRKIHRKTPVPEPLFDKVAILRPAPLLKKRRWHRCFPMNFAKFFRALFLTEHFQWLLLLFTVSVSNAKLERMFSKWKRAKINFRCCLRVKRLENILKIMDEGGNQKNFDPISTIKKQSIDKVRRATEEKGPCSYKGERTMQTMQ